MRILEIINKMGWFTKTEPKKRASSSKKIQAPPSRKYITAYDPKIKRRVVHIVKNGKAISLVTGNKFTYRKNVKRKPRF